MIAGPGGGLRAAGRGHLRASHADREQVIGTLKAAFVQGMLAKDELDLRVGQTLAARTYADLAALTADLPAGLAAAQPPEPAGESANKKKKAAAALACATSGWVGILFALPPMPDGPVAMAIGLVMFVLFAAVSTGWLLLFHAWLDERAGRKSARGRPPGAGGQPSQRSVPADPAGQLPQAGRDPRRAGVRHPGETASHRRARTNHVRPGQGRMAGEAAVPP